MLTTAERDTLLAAFKSGDAAALKKALAAQPTLGYVEGANKVEGPGQVRLPALDGRREDRHDRLQRADRLHRRRRPEREAEGGYDLAYVLLILDADGKGTGEAAPAAKLKFRDDGALVTEDYGAGTVWLKDVARK